MFIMVRWFRQMLIRIEHKSILKEAVIAITKYTTGAGNMKKKQAIDKTIKLKEITKKLFVYIHKSELRCYVYSILG